MINQFLRVLGSFGQRTARYFFNLRPRQILAGVGALIVILLVCFMLFTAGWDRPPVEGVQTGYRGSGQELVYNPREVSREFAQADFSQAPPLASGNGKKAKEVMQNVHVLRNLSVGQFIRLMQGMTQSVAPEQGCSYCHANGNFASDELYTKRVARRMLQMTRQINTKWSPHVDNVGVTCYTCHRGKHIPSKVWANEIAGMTAEGSGRLPPTASRGFASLPKDTYQAYFNNDRPINVQGNTSLPTGNFHSIKQAESVFNIMIHMSSSLGVNCSYCHNSRAFASWQGQGRANKIRAWYGIYMLREVNTTYMNSLTDTFPADRKGPSGKPYKMNCQTCHQGVYKPLYGQKVIANYPGLAVPNNRGGNGRPIPPSAPKPGSNKAMKDQPVSKIRPADMVGVSEQVRDKNRPATGS